MKDNGIFPNIPADGWCPPPPPPDDTLTSGNVIASPLSKGVIPPIDNFAQVSPDPYVPGYGAPGYSVPAYGVPAFEGDVFGAADGFGGNIYGAPATDGIPGFDVLPPVPKGGYHNGYSDRLNSLIEASIIDGTLDEMRRNVLVRNALAEGVSLDEFVVFLEARLYKRRRELEAEQRESMMPPAASDMSFVAPYQEQSSRDNSVKMGMLRRCPACNAVVRKATATACSECGYEFDVLPPIP